MLVSVAIFALITSSALYKYASFDSHILLKSTAYEMALSIREAQVKSLSALGISDTNFRVPFGVTFKPDATSYTVFSYTGSGFPKHTDTSIPLDFVDIESLLIKRGMKIADICVTASGTEYCHSAYTPPKITQLDISFKRPEFEALFYVKSPPTEITNGNINATGQIINYGNIESAKIKLISPLGTLKWVVEVSLLGQITVTAEQ
jgi:hypothetical protein